MVMDDRSFKRLFLPYHPKLYRIAYALVGDKADAEDLLQEAYCKLWNKRHELSDIRNPEAFAVTLIKNLCLDHLRSARANRYEESIDNVSVAAEVLPDRDLEVKDEMNTIQELINRLPENQQQVLRLRSIEDCSLEEIESITGFSAVNVRTLLSRARKMIREQYERLYAYER